MKTSSTVLGQRDGLVARGFVNLAVLLEVFGLVGCSGPKESQREPTFPVIGVVQIDGKPTPLVQVQMFAADKAPDVLDHNTGALHTATTDSMGRFQITTYESGDGAPPRNYVIAFYWPGNQTASLLPSPDEPKLDPAAARFNKKYGAPAKSTVKVTVEPGKPVDLKTLELTTK